MEDFKIIPISAYQQKFLNLEENSLSDEDIINLVMGVARLLRSCTTKEQLDSVFATLNDLYD